MLLWVLLIVLVRYAPQLIFDSRNARKVVVESAPTKWSTRLITTLWAALISSVFLEKSATPPFAPWCARFGILLVVCGALLGLVGVLALGDSYSRNIIVFKDHKLVTTGIYATIRHPIRLAMALETLGAVFVAGVWLLVPLHAALCACLILRSRDEDRLLIKHFGVPAREYQRRVPSFGLRLNPS